MEETKTSRDVARSYTGVYMTRRPVPLGVWLDKTVGFVLVQAIITVSIDLIVHDGWGIVGIPIFASMLLYPALLFFDGWGSRFLFGFSALPFCFANYVLCDLAPSSACEVLHVLHSETPTILLAVYGFLRGFWMIVRSIQEDQNRFTASL